MVLALETASGPVRLSSASAVGWSGIRSATVPCVSPRSHASEGCACTISVSPPGQKCVGEGACADGHVDRETVERGHVAR